MSSTNTKTDRKQFMTYAIITPRQAVCEFSQGCTDNNTLIPQKTLLYLLSNLGQIESTIKKLPSQGHVLSVMTNLLSMVTRGLSA